MEDPNMKSVHQEAEEKRTYGRDYHYFSDYTATKIVEQNQYKIERRCDGRDKN
jgi:hypothetical protein